MGKVILKLSWVNYRSKGINVSVVGSLTMKGNYKYGMAEGKTLMEMSEFGRTGEFMVLKIWICICMHACIYACKYTYVYKHTYVSVYIYMYVFVYVYIMHIFITFVC